MQNFLLQLKEIVLSFSFLTFLYFSSAAFASRKIYRSELAKVSLSLIGETWEALYYLHLFLNFVTVAASYIALAVHFNFFTFITVLLLATSISASIQKSIMLWAFDPKEAKPIEKIAVYFKVITITDSIIIAIYFFLVYRQYFLNH